MPHDHHHHHHAEGDRSVALAVAVNVALTVVQLVGGVLAGSIALIADAIHNFADAGALFIAWGARRIARRPTDTAMTFGYGRIEVVAALINYTTLIVIGLWLLYEAGTRLVEPPEVAGGLMIVIAGVALAVDLVTAFLTFRLSKTSVNIRAAFLHNLADAMGSVGVILAGAAVALWDWRLVDPLVTLAIAAYILWMSVTEIGPVIRILMLGSPPDLDVDEVIRGMEGIPGVADVHHVHLWQLNERRASLEVHVVVAEGRWPEVTEIKQRLRSLLDARFGIGHMTLDMEEAGAACSGAARIGGHG
jgi:cobalt-zinc-cadmium efflux system protein